MRRTEGSRLLLAHPRVRIMALCGVPKNTVSQWCSGLRIGDPVEIGALHTSTSRYRGTDEKR